MLATDGDATYVLFHYGAWGMHDGTSGFNAGDGIRSSGIGSPNVGIPGAYYFRVDQESIILPTGNYDKAVHA